VTSWLSSKHLPALSEMIVCTGLYNVVQRAVVGFCDATDPMMTDAGG